MGDVENDDLRLGLQPRRRVGEGEQRKQSPEVSILRTMKPKQFGKFRLWGQFSTVHRRQMCMS